MSRLKLNLWSDEPRQVNRNSDHLNTTTLFVLSVLYCSYAVGNALASAPTLIQVQNTPTNVIAIGLSESLAYPLKASANNRYLVDQNDVPFLMVGDSPQALIGNLSPVEAAFFMQSLELRAGLHGGGKLRVGAITLARRWPIAKTYGQSSFPVPQ